MSEQTQRVDYLDTAKGIGILLVCIGHACTNSSSVADCHMADLIRFVTLFHMALFFFINGMLYHSKYSVRPVQGAWKKIRAYYLPFLKYNLFFWLFHNLFAHLQLISGLLDPKDYAYQGVRAYAVSFLKSIVGFRQRFAGAMWFLEALIVISVVFIFVDYLSTRLFTKRRILAMTIAIAGILLLNRLLNLSQLPFVPESLTQMVYWGLNGLLFFFLGYLYRLSGWNERLLRFRSVLVPVFAVVLILTVAVMRPRIVSVITNASIPVYKSISGAFFGAEGMNGLPLMPYVFYSFVCLCGILLTILVSQYKVTTGCGVLKTLGKYSLHIMCLQFLAFKSVSLVIILAYHLPAERLAEYPVIYGINGAWWIAYTVSGCVLPVLAVKLLEKTKGKIAAAYRRKRHE